MEPMLRLPIIVTGQIECRWNRLIVAFVPLSGFVIRFFEVDGCWCKRLLCRGYGE